MDTLQIPPQATPAAFEQLRSIGGNDGVLRVAVDGGGCSGFQYRIELGEAADEDLILSDQDNKIVIDPVSLPFLSGAVIDYKVELIGSRFVIENPNAATSCGCGTSFSI